MDNMTAQEREEAMEAVDRYGKLINTNNITMKSGIDCNCMKDIESKVKEHVLSQETNPKGFEIVSSGWERATWYPKKRLYTHIILESRFEKKDGIISKPRNGHVAIHFSYCPFCGKKYEETKITQ